MVDAWKKKWIISLGTIVQTYIIQLMFDAKYLVRGSLKIEKIASIFTKMVENPTHVPTIGFLL
jgi:hypothetical protein